MVEKKMFTINIEIGGEKSGFAMDFYALLMQGQDNRHLDFIHCEENGEMCDPVSALYLNLEEGKVGFNYDMFFINLHIDNKKQVGEYNFCLECSSDLLSCKIYVAEYELWTQEGEDLFA